MFVLFLVRIGCMAKKLQFKNVTPFYVVSILLLISAIAVLAYFALEPYEQSARERDKERRSGVERFTSSLTTYHETTGEYPSTNGEITWAKVLLESGSTSFIPSPVEYKTMSFCASNTVSDSWCYANDGENAIVYTKLESKAELARCNTSEFDTPFFLWSSEMDKSGIVCTDGADPNTESIKFAY